MKRFVKSARFVRLACAGSFMVAAIAGANSANASLMLPEPTPQTSQLFGDFHVFSLPFLNNLFGGGFDVPSTPGVIKDFVVLATGASGMPVNTNFPGMDNAYPTPSGVAGSDFFGTQTTTDPGSAGGVDPVGDAAGTWDTDIAALRQFLIDNASDELAFFFNLNETDNVEGLDGQDMLGWGAVTVIDEDGILPTLTFFLSAADDPLTASDEHADGLTASMSLGGPEPDPSINPTGTGDDPSLRDAQWAYIHGRITVDADGNFLHFGAPLGTDPPGAMEINQNLGADHAAFVMFNQQLSDLVFDPFSGYETLSFDMRFSRIDNGFEQIFIQPVNVAGFVIPEPSTLALWSLGAAALVGFGWPARKRAG